MVYTCFVFHVTEVNAFIPAVAYSVNSTLFEDGFRIAQVGLDDLLDAHVHRSLSPHPGRSYPGHGERIPTESFGGFARGYYSESRFLVDESPVRFSG